MREFQPMLPLRWSRLCVVLLGGCDLYFGSAQPDAAADAASLDGAPDSTPYSPPDGSEPNGPDDSPSLTPAPGAACTTPLPTTASSYVAPSTCGSDGYVVSTIVNSNHMRAALVAQWLECAGSPFANSDEIGIEFAADGRWYKLDLDGAGGVARGHGFDNEGTYELLYEVDHIQLNLNIAGSGTIFFFPEFTTNPVKLRLNNFGFGVGDYIRFDDTGACLPLP